MRSQNKILTFLTVSILILNFNLTDCRAQEPLSINKSLNIAMANSPDIKRLELQIERSRNFLKAKNASLKTQFSVTLNPFNYERTRRFSGLYSEWYSNETKSSSGVFTLAQPIKWTDGSLRLINELSWQDSYSEFADKQDKSYRNYLYLSFNQPIFTYNRSNLELNELELDLENTTLNYAIEKLLLEYQVTQNFYAVYRRKSGLSVAIDDYNNREQSYKIISNKVDAGLVAKEELYQAELDLVESEGNVQDQETALENALDSFKKLIGLSIFDDITVTADVSHNPVEVDLQKALDSALKYRMELRQREIDIENARYDLMRASATNEFRGDINVNYGIIGTDENLRDVFSQSERSQGFSIEFNIPFIDWGYRKYTLEANKAMVRNRELSLEDQKNEIIIEVRQAYRNLKNLVNQIEISEKSVRNAQLTYDINLERYENGDISSMDLNLFQNQLTKAKLNKINALIDYKLELLNMKVLSLYDFEKDQRVVVEELIQTND